MRNQKGFTLIEIIAVLVILGILAAVAVPRYFSLQDDARDAAMSGAQAAAMGNLSQAYAKFLVNGGSAAQITGSAITGTGAANVALPLDLGDFTASYSGGTSGNCSVTIAGKATAKTSWATGYNNGNTTNVKTTTCPWDAS